MYQDILEEVRENHIDTLIFDLDGTLLDTKELIDHSFIETFRHFRPDYELSDGSKIIADDSGNYIKTE